MILVTCGARPIRAIQLRVEPLQPVFTRIYCAAAAAASAAVSVVLLSPSFPPAGGAKFSQRGPREYDIVRRQSVCRRRRRAKELPAVITYIREERGADGGGVDDVVDVGMRVNERARLKREGGDFIR